MAVIIPAGVILMGGSIVRATKSPRANKVHAHNNSATQGRMLMATANKRVANMRGNQSQIQWVTDRDQAACPYQPQTKKPLSGLPEWIRLSWLQRHRLMHKVHAFASQKATGTKLSQW